MQTVEQAFELWARSVLPPGVGATQLKEVRRAFYSGAFITLGVLNDLAGPSDEDDALGAERLQNLYDELRQFFRDVKADRM